MTTFKQSTIRMEIETNSTLDEDRSQSRHEAIGTIYKKQGIMYLAYEERIDEGDVTNLIKVTASEVVITRRGALSSRQRFLVGTETEGLYKTAYGTLTMHTKTKKTEFLWDENRKAGSLLLVYELQLQGSHVGLYRVNIQMEGT